MNKIYQSDFRKYTNKDVHFFIYFCLKSDLQLATVKVLGDVKWSINWDKCGESEGRMLDGVNTI